MPRVWGAPEKKGGDEHLIDTKQGVGKIVMWAGGRRRSLRPRIDTCWNYYKWFCENDLFFSWLWAKLCEREMPNPKKLCNFRLNKKEILMNFNLFFSFLVTVINIWSKQQWGLFNTHLIHLICSLWRWRLNSIVVNGDYFEEDNREFVHYLLRLILLLWKILIWNHTFCTGRPLPALL